MTTTTATTARNQNIIQLDKRSISWDGSTRQLSSNLSQPLQSNGEKKVSCRYGIGCTHIHDPLHLERFTHPTVRPLDQEVIRNSYLCAECGLAYSTLAELRDHLLRKTAWSNSSLVGCKISCYLDGKEWQDGVVTQYHKSGKHSVEFTSLEEKRWLVMTKVAFYITERSEDVDSEYKENEDSIDRNSILLEQTDADSWNYTEDISIDFAFAQSVLFKVYGGVIQETGHKTRGHLSLTNRDREIAKAIKGSLLYGELLARGVNKALGPQRLDAATRSVMYDLGMGTGKVLIQAFLQFRNLSYLFGVEISLGRYLIAEEAVLKMISLLGEETFEVEIIAGSSIKITEHLEETIGGPHVRVLHMVCGNMFHIRDLDKADIIMLETEIPQDLHGDLCRLLNKMKEGAQTLTYHDIRRIWTLGEFPFKQLEVNRYVTDRYPTSWSVQRGHHFFLWRKMVLVQSKDTAAMIQNSPNTPSSVSSISQELRQNYSHNSNICSTNHDQRAPDRFVPPPSPQSHVVSTGCFHNSFISSFFGLFRKRPVGEHESEKVVPLKEEKVDQMTLEISPQTSQTITPPTVNSKSRSRSHSRRSPQKSTTSKSSSKSSSNRHTTSIVGDFPPHSQSLPLSDHNLGTTNLGKSSLPSLVQPLTNSTTFLYNQQLNQSSAAWRSALPIDESSQGERIGESTVNV